MNVRALLHTLAVVCTAIATGTAVIAVDPELNKVVVSACGIVALAINSYMGFTTSGAAK